MMHTGALGRIDVLTYEFHSRNCPIVYNQTRHALNATKEYCRAFESTFPTLAWSEFGTEALKIDDESYRDDGKPLPYENKVR